jgi:hypothetical protein
MCKRLGVGGCRGEALRGWPASAPRQFRAGFVPVPRWFHTGFVPVPRRFHAVSAPPVFVPQPNAYDHMIAAASSATVPHLSTLLHFRRNNPP